MRHNDSTLYLENKVQTIIEPLLLYLAKEKPENPVILHKLTI